MRSIRRVLYGLLLFLGFLASCAVQSTVIKPNYDFKQIKRVAVVDFKDASWLPNSGQMPSDLFVKYLLKTGYNVIERDELNAILREHQLSVEGILNREQTKQFGKIAGVDALITGSITQLVPEREFYENGNLRFIAAQAGITCRMISVETGEILWAGSNTYDGMNTQTAFEYLVSSLVNQFIKDAALSLK
jgi:curli biogenesis system outer membrane secretion channel CsgG